MTADWMYRSKIILASRLNPKSKQSVCDSKKRSNNTIRIGLANNRIVFQFTLLRQTKNVQRKM